ncbi:hypothetical protein JMJ77_0013450 [Colletotrichum scovillei]|uniref:Uncharacterized protein n=1 Tax=Colletotrichum scovillei TaxID=1209932 RepID=A0A9P7R7C8_9PEZI|nr:hypothetical protein JMJ77_0013450 [Colletotrichum scovillei]KAG7069751.1 hypothetical protein JMJ76_0003414 [Colletotrichum scovillei]KAG7073757.1 hypothetical protein JMJ78_0014724 [Colletotrichum scovillei]
MSTREHSNGSQAGVRRVSQA